MAAINLFQVPELKSLGSTVDYHKDWSLYNDILPYHRFQINGEDSDLNASMIEYPGHLYKYIASQIPLVAPEPSNNNYDGTPESTPELAPKASNSVWYDMIKAYGVKLIVNLTSKVKNADKIYKYWEDKEWKNLEIDSKYSQFLALKQKDDVYHLHYFNWVDHGTPDPVQFKALQKVYNILICQIYTGLPVSITPTYKPPEKRLSTLKTYYPRELPNLTNIEKQKMYTAPIVVHCEAGVGRTGVFIASDIMAQKLQQNYTPNDIVDIMIRLRHFRPCMVQAVNQFKFLVDTYCNEQNFPACRRFSVICNGALVGLKFEASRKWTTSSPFQLAHMAEESANDQAGKQYIFTDYDGLVYSYLKKGTSKKPLIIGSEWLLKIEEGVCIKKWSSDGVLWKSAQLCTTTKRKEEKKNEQSKTK